MNLHIAKGHLQVLALLVAGSLLVSCGTKGQAEPAPGSIVVLGTPASSDLIKQGGEIYRANCQICHGGATGGKLRDIPPPHNTNGHTWHHADQQIIEMALNGISFSMEELKMPAFKDKLSEEDVRATLAYVKTWWTEDQRKWQRNVTEQWDR